MNASKIWCTEGQNNIIPIHCINSKVRLNRHIYLFLCKENLYVWSGHECPSDHVEHALVHIALFQEYKVSPEEIRFPAY